MDSLVFYVIVSHLYVEVQLSEIFVLLLQLSLGVGDFSYFQENVFNPLCIYCWQDLCVEVIDTSLHKLCLFLHEEVSINDLSFLLHRFLS